MQSPWAEMPRLVIKAGGIGRCQERPFEISALIQPPYLPGMSKKIQFRPGKRHFLIKSPLTFVDIF